MENPEPRNNLAETLAKELKKPFEIAGDEWQLDVALQPMVQASDSITDDDILDTLQISSKTKDSNGNMWVNGTIAGPVVLLWGRRGGV